MTNSNVSVSIPEDKRLILTHGIAGSGKSTWAQALVDAEPQRFVRVNRDDLRLSVFGDNYFATSVREQEKMIDVIQMEAIVNYLRDGKTVIVDDTNIKPWVIWRIVSAGFASGLTVENLHQEYLDVPISAVHERNRQRHAEGGRLAPSELIEQMYELGYGDDGKLRRYDIREDGVVTEGRIYTTDKVGELVS